MKRLLLASCGFIFLSGAIFLAAETAVASCDTITVLELCVAATPDPVKPGEQIVYSYTVANRGAVDLAGVVLTTLVPDHTMGDESLITGGGDCTPVNDCRAGHVVHWSLGTVFAGQSRTVQMAVRVDTISPPADGTVISDSATVVDSSGQTTVAARSVVADNTPVLMLSMAGDREPVEPGGVLTYTLIFGNRGAVNAPGVTLSASVPAGTTFVSASDGGTQSGGTVSWFLGTVSVGESGRRQFTVQISTGLSNGILFISDASIQDGVDPQDTARASVSTAVRGVASTPLTLSLTATPDPVKPGEQIVYSYTVANRGAVDLAGVVLTTLVPDHTMGDESLITGGGDCTPVNDCRAGHVVHWSLGTVFAGQSRTVQMAVRVDTISPPADGTVISDSATVVDSSGQTTVAARSVVADNTPVLMLSMAGDREPVEPGGVLTYTLIFGNRGAVNAPGVTLSASVPAGTTFVSASDGGTQSGGTVSWFLGTVSVGESGRRQFTVQISTGLSNGILFISDASIQDGVDPQDTARASVSTAVRGVASTPLTLSLTATPDPVKPGEQIVYSYTVANRGAVDLAGVVLTTLVPDHTMGDESLITGGGDCTPVNDCRAGHVVHWSLGTVFAGQSRTVQMAVRVDTISPPADGTVIPDSATVVDGAQIFDERDTAATRVCAAGGTRCDFVFVPPPLVAAILPSSRSVQVGTAATVFATIIDAGSSMATGCGVSLITNIPAAFSYQATDPATNQVTGNPNTPVNIAAGAARSFIISLTPTAPLTSTDVQFSFNCSNTNPAAINSGLNTLLFSVSATPIPDIVALAATATNDGIVNIPGTNGTGAFAVATVNVGASGNITASADTGSASLPVNIALCQTDPANGQCISGIGPRVTTQINANATPTFAIFVQGNGNVPFDPAANRIFVRFKDGGGVTRGSTSVAVRTQ